MALSALDKPVCTTILIVGVVTGLLVTFAGEVMVHVVFAPVHAGLGIMSLEDVATLKVEMVMAVGLAVA